MEGLDTGMSMSAKRWDRRQQLQVKTTEDIMILTVSAFAFFSHDHLV